ncbi:hypothetical protein [Neomoorella humiferrea]|uniref:Uncharacterized protein n=1 Tax=Neomoorella humiferrea TaxID=676965 RepID=A0A2T0AQR4_9FIRM|nr:hypothetical protein [Moorella humiferrea]PRR71641.1 hypothetical protein MOHU_16250 [Moorella humiferrea]
MDLSLHHESYTDDELKMLLIGVSWTVDDDCRVLFSTDVLQVSGDEMEEAETRIKEIMEENKENEEKQEAGQKIMQILAKYPAYGNFIYANMWRKAQPAYQALKEGKLKLIMPLYAVAGGVYAFIASTMAIIPAEVVKSVINRC